MESCFNNSLDWVPYQFLLYQTGSFQSVKANFEPGINEPHPNSIRFFLNDVAISPFLSQQKGLTILHKEQYFCIFFLSWNEFCMLQDGFQGKLFLLCVFTLYILTYGFLCVPFGDLCCKKIQNMKQLWWTLLWMGFKYLTFYTDLWSFNSTNCILTIN